MVLRNWFWDEAAVVIHAATGALLYKVACQYPETLNPAAHVRQGEQWIDLDDPNDLSDATIYAKILAVTGKVAPLPVEILIIDVNTNRPVSACMAHPGINDLVPPRYYVVRMPASPPSGNPDWSQWTHSPATGQFSAPSLPPPAPRRQP